MLHWLPVLQRIQFRIAISAFVCVREHCPAYLSNVCILIAGVSGRAHLRSTRIQLFRREFPCCSPSRLERASTTSSLTIRQSWTVQDWVENPSLHTGLRAPLENFLLKSVFFTSHYTVVLCHCRGWMTRICRVPLFGDSVQDRDFQMPVFAFVFTKFRKMPDAKPVSTQANYTDFFVLYMLCCI